MEFIKDLMGSLFWATAFSLLFYGAASIAIGFLAKKSAQLKPIGSGLNLIILFIAVQLFLHLGAAEYHPRISLQLNFFSWLVFTFAALRLGLYLYGDLFVVRWKRGSFPAAFKNIITALVIVIVALVLLKEIMDINVTSLIATTTVLTATIGLAFQSTLSNMLAGLTIHLEKPLKQGDWISAAGHEGRVMDISLRSTRIMTIEHNEVFIPNGKILSEAVVNFSLPNTLQVRKLTVGVSYSDPPNKTKNVILEVLSSVPRVMKFPAPVVRVINYGDFAVQFEIRFSITDFAAHVEIEAEIMNLLWYEFKRNEIEIPYPVRSVHLHQITPETRHAEQERRADELMNMMKNVEIFSFLSKVELRDLVAHVSVKTYAAGEVPVRQGEPGSSFYIIKSGKVDVVVEKSSRERAVVATLGPGNFFGEMSLLTGALRTASIRVKDDAEFIVIDKESFRTTLINNPSIAENLSQILSERQAGLDTERERLDASALERRKKDDKSKLLSKMREFFGLDK
ncbi:MAG: mechanosensitive ion channel family protein [Nitrospirae bacterium]|nr:mechanosensitive ion channel family protein [Nitrospirota bacterium]